MIDDAPAPRAILLTVELPSWTGGSPEIVACPVELAADGSPRNLDGGSWSPDPLAYLRASAAAELDPAGAPRLWTMSGAYYHRPYGVDARRAAMMAATFRKIETRTARATARYGPPADWPASLLRLADALDIPRFVYRVDADYQPTTQPYTGTYSDARWTTTDPAGALSWVAHQLRALAPTLTPR
jgi:hypothetical protein